MAQEKALAAHRGRVAQARQARDQARVQHRWGAWLRGIHLRAHLRSSTRPTVDICTSVRQLGTLLNGYPVAITATERAELERLIIRDHRFHERRH